MDFAATARDALVVLAAGTLSAVVCRKWSLSLLLGYLVVGGLIGPGGLGLVTNQSHELEMLAEAGALFLLFAVGLEFSPNQLAELRKFIAVGGALQMFLATVPLAGVAWLVGMGPGTSILVGAAGALSSTILVFRALMEEGMIATAAGKRAVAVLLCQDVALVPLLLMVPMLVGEGGAPGLNDMWQLVGKSLVFLASMAFAHFAVHTSVVPLLARLRSVELVVLFTVSLIGTACLLATTLELPAAIGSLAAGVVLGGNRLSHQIDSVVLPFRETFAAVFFVTLGMLLNPGRIVAEPVLLLGGIVGTIGVKSLAASVALRIAGLGWRSALGTGLALSQLGEFSFLLVARAQHAGLLPTRDYERLLVMGLATLLLTPLLIRWGFALAATDASGSTLPATTRQSMPPEAHAVVLGAGPIGGQVVSRLETLGLDVAIVDLSPVNLHAFAQLGFATYSGDARDREVLERAAVDRCGLVVVCIPDDGIAVEVIRAVRRMAPKVGIVVRCRYQSRIASLRRAGADQVVSEEAEVSAPLLTLCEQWLAAHRPPRS